MTNDLGERRNLDEERESEEYQAMYYQVEAEIKESARKTGDDDLVPAGCIVHQIVMRRLKAKYESACGK